MVTIRNNFNVKHCTTSPRNTSEFCLDLRTNSDYFPIQNCLIRFSIHYEFCSLHSTNWIFQVQFGFRSASCSDITQRIVRVPWWRFGTTVQESFWGCWSLKVRPIGCPESRQGITTTRGVMSQNRAHLIYFAAVAWNHTLRVDHII